MGSLSSGAGLGLGLGSSRSLEDLEVAAVSRVPKHSRPGCPRSRGGLAGCEAGAPVRSSLPTPQHAALPLPSLPNPPAPAAVLVRLYVGGGPGGRGQGDPGAGAAQQGAAARGAALADRRKAACALQPAALPPAALPRSGGVQASVQPPVKRAACLSVIAPQVVSKLHQILKPFLLRRVKTDVETSLPGKMEVRPAAAAASGLLLLLRACCGQGGHALRAARLPARPAGPAPPPLRVRSAPDRSSLCLPPPNRSPCTRA